jgi:geranylgeranyl reductase family protein
MDTADVAVVGGGPAGSTVAWRLREAGFRVALIDRALFPRDKVCAGWITPSVIESLDLDLEDYRKKRVFQPIRGFQVSLMSGPAAEIQYPETVSYGIRRYEFDDYLLRRSGAELHLGEPLHSIRREGSDWVLNEKIRTPLLIGAGGHRCPVARFLGKGREDHGELVIAQEAEFAVPTGKEDEYRVDPQRPELYFSDDLKGYGWCFRKGEYLNIGLGREDRSGLSHYLTDFVQELKRRKKVPRDFDLPFKGHSYLLGSHSSRPLAGEGVLLVGDSAGLACTESGEGIGPAVESALLAAETIIESKGHYDYPGLASYEFKILREFGPRGKVDREGQGLLPLKLKAWVAKVLMARRWFVKRVVLDQWFLHQNRPVINKPKKVPFQAA